MFPSSASLSCSISWDYLEGGSCIFISKCWCTANQIYKGTQHQYKHQSAECIEWKYFFIYILKWCYRYIKRIALFSKISWLYFCRSIPGLSIIFYWSDSFSFFLITTVTDTHRLIGMGSKTEFYIHNTLTFSASLSYCILKTTEV